MAEEDAGTLNDAGGQPAADTGASSTPKASEGDLVPTVELGIETIPEGDASSAPDDKGEGGKEGAPEAKTGGEDEGGKPKDGGVQADDLDTRFDKHPRFVELNERVKAAETMNANLQRQLQDVQKQPPGGEGSEQLPYKDIAEMSDEDLLEWQQDDPKGYYANVLQQAKHEVGQDLAGRMDERNYESQIEHTFTEFAKDNPDFDEMWDRGELQRFMQIHPGHNAISAYRELTYEKRIADESAKAVADAEKKWNEGLKTKRESQTLSSGPAASGTGGTVAGKTPPELQDTKKFGGLTTVLAKRSADRLKKMRGG